MKLTGAILVALASFAGMVRARKPLVDCKRSNAANLKHIIQARAAVLPPASREVADRADVVDRDVKPGDLVFYNVKPGSTASSETTA
jgi:hypothetical protein